ncbi:glutamate 5-kinase [mine drainage metagenome]|uniref:Glutamate 5-kinase n=1 Tax=mine drainage metagenome TaxID=410659 RepID=A0A1J5Q4X4_9ZZZZ
MTREQVVSAKRIVVKVGSSSLTGTAGSALDNEAINSLVSALATARNSGHEILLVSSGAIATGLAPLGLRTRPKDLATQQAAASVGQGLLMHRYTDSFAQYGITTGQILLTAEDVIRRSHYQNAQRTLSRLLALNVVPIINENDTVATHEIRLGDNDRLAALVAHLVHADLLVLLSDVDALYTGDPRKAGVSAISEVRSMDELRDIELGKSGAAGVGSGGMATKIEAARIAMTAGIPVVLTSTAQASAALAGEEVGTFFHGADERRPSRLLWLAHASSPRGRVVLDSGAVAAVVERRLSLLPAGVTAVSGEFAAGEPVDLVDQDGVVVARGLIAFDSSEIPSMLGRSTKELGSSLGAEYERELVHRDDLVLL